MIDTKIYSHGVAFCNPYEEPPDGLPKQLVQIETKSHTIPDWFKRKVIKIIDRLYARGIYSYSLTFDCFNTKPPKQWSEEAKVKNRLKRLRDRMSKRYSIPELLELAVAEKIAQKPEYYTVQINSPN